jgi:SAM-dependent methyltransferase
MIARSPWRTLLYKELASTSLRGAILDLGGSRTSAYTKHFKGEYTITVANFEAAEVGDIALDLERPFPIADVSYDGVLCINVLEHIFNYQNVISETKRILTPGGQAIFAVPFLIQVHPSPHDHWRFTEETLRRLFTDAGFTDVVVTPIGTGVASAIMQLKFNILHVALLRRFAFFLGNFVDAIIARFDHKGAYSKRFYPLGYVVTIQK